jgi:glutamate N-acetyltransferase/amino-acid N-acetyltransferase
MANDGSFISVPGGVTAAAGFLAGSIHCGIKAANLKKPDLAMVRSEGPAAAAATFTTNKIKAAPVKVSAAHLSRTADVRAVILNSGNANACTGVEGIDSAKRMARAAAQALKVRENQVLVCSTGRIGVPLPIEKIEEKTPLLAAALTRKGSKAAARAIMTSDTFPKEVAVQGTLSDGRVYTIGGMAKGAGMIDPNMATMLCVVTTDAPLVKRDLQRALSIAVEQSFNRITIDGDMSTNDTVIALANGRAGGRPLTDGADFERFQEALNHVTRNLARLIVEDGEGVTRFVEVRVSGAATFQDARKAAEAVANSSLVKCAWYGGDPNWGRILDALGYSTAALREELVDVYYNGLIAVKAGVASRTPKAKLQEVVQQKKFTVHIHLHLGSAEYEVYTSDLTPDYVRFNKGE